MKLKFKNIELHNFLSIEDANINLLDRGYTLVYGINNNECDNALSNGAGKSTIFEAISWVLTGETIRGTKNIVRLNSEDGCYVKINFTYNNDEYQLIRSKDHVDYKTNLLIYINGEDKSSKGIRDNQKLLLNYIPDLTSDLLGSVIVLGQGLPQKFSSNTPSGRKAIIEKLSKSDFMLEDIKSRLSYRKETLQKELRELEDSKLKLETQLELNNKEIINKTNYISTIEPVSYDEVEEAEKEEANIAAQIEELRNTITNHQSDKQLNESKLSNLKLECDLNKSKIKEKYNSSIEEINSKLASLNAQKKIVKKEIEDIDSITDICPTCGQKLPNVVKISSEPKKEELSTICSKINSLEEEKSAIYNNIKTEEEAILIDFEAHNNEIINNLNSIKDTISHINIELNSLDNKLIIATKNKNDLIHKHDNYFVIKDRLEKEIAKLNNDIESNKKEIEIVSSKIDTCNSKLDVESKLNTIATRDFRGFLISGFINYIDNKAKEYCNEVFNNKNISITLDGNNVDIIFNDKLYENLSGGEKQKIDLIIQFSIREMMCKYLNFSSNILVLDEIFDNCDITGCNSLINLINKKLNDINSIFIVTHHSDLSIPYDNTLTIVKDKFGVSSVCQK